MYFHTSLTYDVGAISIGSGHTASEHVFGGLHKESTCK